MKVGIIVGSHRSESQSSKVAKFVNSQIKKLRPDATIFIFDLRNNPLPLWDESKWKSEGNLTKLWAPISLELSDCDSFIIISPEWSGMVPAGLKNFFLYCDNELAHKPATIISVSSSMGGSYPIAELRMSSYKNTHICYIPEHVILQKIDGILNDDVFDEKNKDDYYVKNRILYCLNLLMLYSEAFKGIRKSDVIDLKKYPYGM
jgi:NAD(P)H-dependent FMN reductase